MELFLFINFLLVQHLVNSIAPKSLLDPYCVFFQACTSSTSTSSTTTTKKALATSITTSGFCYYVPSAPALRVVVTTCVKKGSTTRRTTQSLLPVTTTTNQQKSTTQPSLSAITTASLQFLLYTTATTNLQTSTTSQAKVFSGNILTKGATTKEKLTTSYASTGKSSILTSALKNNIVTTQPSSSTGHMNTSTTSTAISTASSSFKTKGVTPIVSPAKSTAGLIANVSSTVFAASGLKSKSMRITRLYTSKSTAETSRQPTFEKQPSSEITTTKTSVQTSSEELIETFGIALPNIDGGDIELSSSVQDAVPFLVQSLNDSMKQLLGYQLPQVVLSCTYNSVPCDFDADFKWIYNPVYGSCYTYNPGLQPRHMVTRAGSLYGLRIVLSGSQDDYSCLSVNAGYRVVIHENNVVPFPDSDGFNMPPGVTGSFGLHQIKISRLNQPYGVCADSSFDGFSKNYSVEACQRLCFQQMMLDRCKCADPRYLLPQNAIYCGPNQKMCLDYNKNCESDILDSCNCPAPCNEVVYKSTSTNSQMLDDTFKEIYCEEDANSSLCNSDLSTLYVFYNQLQEVTLVEVSAYGYTQIFSDLNGVAGALLGVGIVTFIELTIIIVLFVQKLILSNVK